MTANYIRLDDVLPMLKSVKERVKNLPNFGAGRHLELKIRFQGLLIGGGSALG